MSQATVETAEIVRSNRDEVAVNVLTNAVESGYNGIGYWAGVSDYSRDADLMYTSITVYDKEDMEDGKYVIGTKEIFKAINLIAKGGVVHSEMADRIAKLRSTNKENLDDALCESDATDADAIVQVAAYGKIIFG